MGQTWRADSVSTVTEESVSGDGDGQCSTSRVVRSDCKTEQVELGKFLRKCEITVEILRHCLGMPPQVIHSNKEYTEEYITQRMLNRYSLPHSSQPPPTGQGVPRAGPCENDDNAPRPYENGHIDLSTLFQDV